MENFLNWISENTNLIILAMIGTILVLLISIIVLFISLSKLKRRQKKVFRGYDGQNIEKTITDYMDKIDEVNNFNEELSKKYGEIQNKLEKCVQKVGIKRYRAFDNVGSDLSFSLALLDSNNDGIIITSIFGRQESTIYAKPIDMGISRYDLSDEEKETLRMAIANEQGNIKDK
ncbi:DUF4446 family protein [Clostridium cellulovorans]|uniref:DUF4446 family protein n=1 Tax=Clostridium cellulovorans TaxID=1493 RepID=UPI0001E8EE6B|nr:DUF4446 family protein [Clostridium cellulovorans]